MTGVNKVILLGNLGRDPEVRHLEGGVTVTRFTMATTESYKDKSTGEKKEITEWHNIVLWRGLADVAEKYLRKGSKIYLEGKLKTRSWEKDGVKRYTTEIVGDNFVMLNTKGSEGIHSPSASASASSGTVAETTNPSVENTAGGADDLPF